MELSHLIKLPVVDNVKLTRVLPNKNVATDGTLCLTGHHLICSSRTNKNDELWILHSLIDAVENKLKENKPTLIIKCKNFQVIQIDFPVPDYCQSISQSLEALSNIQSDEVKYPFYYKLNFIPVEDGWQSYTVESEFYKMFPNVDATDWRISTINKNYKYCATYSEKVIVPKIVEDNWLIKSSEFRQGGRFPVLSYYQKDRKAFIMRSSQPVTGSSNRRCKEDETILNKALPSGKKGVIFDTRDINQAKAAVYKGGGYETDANYPLWKRYYINLDRFDQLHVSYGKLIEACNESALTNEKWLSKLESSGWLNSVRNALYMACLVADEIYNKNSCVLIHGYEGFDNTLIVTSLAQILLNADCRTLTGFQALIEREWIQAGHPFSRRYFKSAYSTTSQKNDGPVFVLFLDCVWQLYEQFRLSFEFNEEFLILLFDNLYASEYGTFLGNCERERKDKQLSVRTYSLWSFINQPSVMKNYLNVLYEPNSDPIWPSISPCSLDLWSNLYLRYQMDQGASNEAKSEMAKLKEKESELKAKVIRLRKEILDLEKQAIESHLINPESDDRIQKTA